MSDVYTILFNSRQGTQKNTVLSSTSAVLPTQSLVTYSMDWGLLPAGKYKCSFSFLSMGQTTLATIANNKIAEVFIGGLGNTNIYGAVDNIGVKNSTTRFIGFLTQSPLSTTISALYCDKNMNQPFYIERPNSNQLEIRITDNANPVQFYTDATASAPTTAPFMPHYVMTLYMELVKD